MLNPLHNQQGVTLIEIAVGLAIIAIVFATGVPGFRTWVQNLQIRTATESIQNGLQLARSEAVHRNTPVQFVFGTGSGWTVGCVTASATCPVSIQSRSSAEGTPNASVAITPAGTSTITFNGLGRVTAPASQVTIDVTNPTGGICVTAAGPMRCLRVVASLGGQIRMCDPAQPSTSPQGC